MRKYVTEYDRQPRFVRMCRWLRYRPIWFAWWLVWSLGWLLKGAPMGDLDYCIVATRWEAFLWNGKTCKSAAEMRMGKVVPIEEFFAQFTAEAK